MASDNIGKACVRTKAGGRQRAALRWERELTEEGRWCLRVTSGSRDPDRISLVHPFLRGAELLLLLPLHLAPYFPFSPLAIIRTHCRGVRFVPSYAAAAVPHCILPRYVTRMRTKTFRAPN